MIDERQVIELQGHGQDIPGLLAQWAEQRGDHPVLVWEPGEGEARSWTYAELWADVRALADGLAGRGVGLDDKILIHADNCPEMVVAWLACATLGAVGVTTNTTLGGRRGGVLHREGPLRGRHHPAAVRRPGG